MPLPADLPLDALSVWPDMQPFDDLKPYPLSDLAPYYCDMAVSHSALPPIDPEYPCSAIVFFHDDQAPSMTLPAFSRSTRPVPVAFPAPVLEPGPTSVFYSGQFVDDLPLLEPFPPPFEVAHSTGDPPAADQASLPDIEEEPGTAVTIEPSPSTTPDDDLEPRVPDPPATLRSSRTPWPEKIRKGPSKSSKSKSRKTPRRTLTDEDRRKILEYCNGSSEKQHQVAGKSPFLSFFLLFYFILFIFYFLFFIFYFFFFFEGCCWTEADSG